MVINHSYHPLLFFLHGSFYYSVLFVILWIVAHKIITAASLKSLDANVKRNTAFIKKLKSLSHDNAESIFVIHGNKIQY